MWPQLLDALGSPDTLASSTESLVGNEEKLTDINAKTTYLHVLQSLAV